MSAARKIDYETVMQLLAQGYTVTEVADMVGCSQPTVSVIVKVKTGKTLRELRRKTFDWKEEVGR